MVFTLEVRQCLKFLIPFPTLADPGPFMSFLCVPTVNTRGFFFLLPGPTGPVFVQPPPKRNYFFLKPHPRSVPPPLVISRMSLSPLNPSCVVVFLGFLSLLLRWILRVPPLLCLFPCYLVISIPLV